MPELWFLVLNLRVKLGKKMYFIFKLDDKADLSAQTEVANY